MIAGAGIGPGLEALVLMARLMEDAARPIHVPRVRRLRQKQIAPYLWFVPITVIMAAVLLYPWILSLQLSFQSWTPLRPAPPRWAGIENYTRIFSDPAFYQAMKRTAILVVTTVTIQFFAGFGIALLLNAIRVGRAVLLTMFLLPLLITPSVVGLSWKMLLHNQWGLFNWTLDSLGFARIGWLSDPDWTLPTIIMVDVWQHTPFGVLILLAGLQAVPEEQLEAAKVDGASDVQVFFHIILPFLAPLILITLLFRLIFALRTFDIIFALFRSGGPANEGMVIGVYLYQQLRVAWKLGEASATSFVLLALTMGVGSFFILRWYKGALD